MRLPLLCLSIVLSASLYGMEDESFSKGAVSWDDVEASWRGDGELSDNDVIHLAGQRWGTRSKEEKDKIKLRKDVFEAVRQPFGQSKKEKERERDKKRKKAQKAKKAEEELRGIVSRDPDVVASFIKRHRYRIPQNERKRVHHREIVFGGETLHLVWDGTGWVVFAKKEDGGRYAVWKKRLYKEAREKEIPIRMRCQDINLRKEVAFIHDPSNDGFFAFSNCLGIYSEED